MKRVRRRLWFKFDDGLPAPAWRVRVTTDRIKYNGDNDLRGLTDNTKRTIVISLRHRTLRKLYETTSHELLHAACGPTPDACDAAIEEKIAYRSEIGFAAIFDSLGFQFPELPDGVELLSNVKPAGT